MRHVHNGLGDRPAFFVVRTRKNLQFRRRYSRAVDKSTGLRSDQTIVGQLKLAWDARTKLRVTLDELDKLQAERNQLDAQTALSWGLVSKIVPAATLMEEAMKLANRMAAQPPDVLRMTKRLLREGQSTSFDNIMELSAAMQSLAHHTEDHVEAVNAFFEKRPGNYKGR